MNSNSMDRALLEWVDRETSLSTLIAPYDPKALVMFNATRKFAAVVVTHMETNRARVLLKGALSNVLPRCSGFRNVLGRYMLMTTEFKEEMTALVKAEAKKGSRIIALAESAFLPDNQFPADFEYETDPKPNFPLKELTFVSCLVVSDPPRLTVKAAVRQLREAGIKVTIITGDWAPTAVAIACETGIVTCAAEEVDTLLNKDEDFLFAARESGDHSGAILVTGRDLESISPVGWDFVFLHSELVFSRSTPEQKLQIVREAQRRGHRVGVTGDGVNDSPALKQADVGIAMNSGADVARDVGSIVLLQDDFAAVVHGVREGRLVFSNLRKVVAFMLAGGCWTLALGVLSAVFLGMPQTISMFLIIVISCLTGVYNGVALMMEPPDSDLMHQLPRDTHTYHLVDLRLLCYSFLFYGNMVAVGAFYNYFDYMANRGDGAGLPADYRGSELLFNWERWMRWSQDIDSPVGRDQYAAAKQGSSVYFMTVVVAQMGHLLSIRRKTPYFYAAATCAAPCWPRSDWWRDVRWPVVVAWVASVATVLFFNEIPVFQQYCNTASVPARQWGLAVGWSALWFAIAEIRKWVVTLFPNSFVGRLISWY